MLYLRRYTDGKKAHEKVLNINSHQLMQIKTTLRYHYTPIRMAKQKQKQMLVRTQSNWNSHILLMKMQMVQPLWKVFQQFLIKLNTHLVYAPPIPLLGIYLREMKPYVYTKAYNNFNFVYQFVYIYTMEQYSAIIRNKLLIDVTTWMNL